MMLSRNCTVRVLMYGVALHLATCISALPELGVSFLPKWVVQPVARNLHACALQNVRRSELTSLQALQQKPPSGVVPESIMMPSIKRQASDSFSGPNQSLVKRQKSSSDLRENGALTVSSQGKGKDGALIQSVSLVLGCFRTSTAKRLEQGWLIWWS